MFRTTEIGKFEAKSEILAEFLPSQPFASVFFHTAPSQSQWDVGYRTHSEPSCSDWEGSRSPATFEEPESWKGATQRCAEILPDSARWACACPCLAYTPSSLVMAGQGERGCTFHVSALWWGQMGISLKLITTGNFSYFFVKTFK